MFTILSPIYMKPFEGKQVLERWVVGIVGSIVFLSAAGSAKVAATGVGQTREYGICMRLARASPDEGFKAALAWTATAGGGAAKHCAAVTLFSMGQYLEAAARSEALANEFRFNISLRAELLAQAG